MTLPDTVEYTFGDIVWMKTDEDGNLGFGQVVGILFKPGAVLYQVQFGFDRVNYFYSFELCRDKPNNFAPV